MYLINDNNYLKEERTKDEIFSKYNNYFRDEIYKTKQHTPTQLLQNTLKQLKISQHVGNPSKVTKTYKK